jgi:salicylate hydroxylase
VGRKQQSRSNGARTGDERDRKRKSGQVGDLLAGGGLGLALLLQMLPEDHPRRNAEQQNAPWEQADQLESGTGLSLFPNGRRQLERMNLGDALAEVGARIGEGSAYYRMDGTFVSRVVTTDSSGWNGIYGMHRADLLRVLAAGLPSTAIRWGHRCIAFEQRDFVVRLNFATGQTDTADVVVAADGIQSSLQEYVVEPSTPEYSGSRAYRGLIPKEKVPE